MWKIGSESWTSKGTVLRFVVVVVGLLAAAPVIPAWFGPGSNLSCVEDASVSAAESRGEEKVREPELNAAEEVPAEMKGKGGKGFRATVPTYVHVVTPDGVEGNVPLAKVREQIRVLDETFGGSRGGADTGFDFDLVSVDRTVNAEWYHAGPTTKGERDMKHALHQGGPNALNIYLTTAGIYLGWAYFPSIVDTPGQAYLDGIVVDWKSLPGIGFYPRFDLGFTATHEVGHWINLHHTFNGGCSRWGDYVDDTPPQLVPTRGCPEGQDTCREPGLDPIHNYMDYSDDPCYTEFTEGQSQRMQDAWLHWRA